MATSFKRLMDGSRWRKKHSLPVLVVAAEEQAEERERENKIRRTGVYRSELQGMTATILERERERSRLLNVCAIRFPLCKYIARAHLIYSVCHY